LASSLVLALAFVALLATGGRADASLFTPGTVEVNGYAWTIDPLKVQIPQDGTTTKSALEILQEAESKSSKVDVATVPDIAVTLPGKAQSVKCSGNQLRSGSSKCPTFTASADYTVMSFVSGSKTHQVRYQATSASGSPGLNPQIYIGQASSMSVLLSPPSKKIDSGDTVDFKATVTGATGKLTYSWDFGDGSSKTTSTGTISHKFTGDDQAFTVVVNVTQTGSPRREDDLSTITVGKVKKSTKKKKKKTKDDDGNNGDEGTYDPGYVPGYSDNYYDGTGTSPGSGNTSSGSPSTTSPDKPKPNEDKTPVESSGDTVTGQLIDPTTTATVIPPTDNSTGSTEEANPQDDPDGGGGLPAGAKAALGIGGLLGLGGLAEAGAFTGALRRFRFRP
jgi:hypothetical protein